MAWLYLLIASLFEIGWAVGLKLSQGFTRPQPAAWTLVAMIASFFFLALALRTIPLGTAYAVWTGLGAAGTAVMGMYLFDESKDPLRFLCLSLIVVGVVGLKLVAGRTQPLP
jgi:quaternary ammonium compound-resistance protein SugE